MTSQHLGLSQPRSRQQQGLNDLQLWQQHLMHKQIQEIQRQQFQQLDQGGRPQYLHTPLTGVARQTAVDQFPGVLNGMPVCDASNYMWSNEHVEGELKTPSSSHMPLAGSVNMAQHSGSPMHGLSNVLMFSHNQGHLIRPMGSVAQFDQSLNGTPVSHIRGSSIYFSQLQGMSHDFTDAMTKAGRNHEEKPLMQSSALNCFQSDHFVVPEQGCLQDSVLVAKQAFQGKGSFAIAPVQSPNSGATSGDYRQADHFSHSLVAQEFQGRQEENDWAGRKSGATSGQEEKAVLPVKSSCDGTSLDPTEEKLLFGTDDDGNWAASYGSSITNSTGLLHDKPSESNEHFGAFPSIQSGSWSALMQEAVEASSSDTGLHEEWSGLSFQKTELSSGNRSAVLSDNGKQQMMWDDSNLQSASSMTSRPFPLFNDADASSNCCTTSSFQHPAKFAYELNERVSIDASHKSIQQPSKEGSGEHLDPSHQQKQFVGAAFQAQTHMDNVSNGVWGGPMYEQSVNFAPSTGTELNLQNLQVLVHQQKMPLPNVDSQLSNKSTGWNVSGSLPPDLLKGHDNDVTNQVAQRYETNRTLHMENNHDSSIWKVGTNQVAVSFPNFSGGLQPVRSDIGSPRVSNDDTCVVDFAANTASSSTMKFIQEVNQHAWGQHAWISSLNNTDHGSGEMYNHKQENSLPKEISNEGHVFRQSHPTQHTDIGGGARENSLLAGNEHHPLVTNGQKSSGQSSQKTFGPHKFQYHPMGNLGMSMETDSQGQRSYSQGSSHLMVQGSKNQEQAGHVIGYSAFRMGTGHLIDSQRSAKGMEEVHYLGSILGHDSALSSFDGSVACFPRNSSGQASQNMLDLLHKMDQSGERNTVACFSDSERNAPSEIPKSAASDGSAYLQHGQSSVLKGFGLKLAQPSQRQPLSSHSWHSQTSLQALNDSDSKGLDSGGGGNQMWSTSTTKILSLPHHEASQGENMDNESCISGQASKSNIYEKSLAPSSLPYAWNTDISISNELATMHHSASTFGSQTDIDGRNNYTSLPKATDDSNGGALAEQSSQASLPNVDGSVSYFRLAPSADTCAPITSQVYSLDSGHSELINANAHAINSGQQLSLVESKSVDQHSSTAGFSHRGDFSTIPHNVWANGSSQQHLFVSQPQKTVPIVNQSISPLPSMSGGSAPCEFGVSSINSYQQKPPDKVDVAARKGSASRGQELVRKHLSDGNSAISIPSLVHLHQQDLNRAKHGQYSNFASLSHDKVASGQTIKSLDVHTQNYSLLQQMQAMKDAEPDPSRRIGKRLKGTNLGSDALQMERTGSQRFIIGQDPVLKELNASFQHGSFPSDVQMLSFSLKGSEDRITNACSQITSRDLPSQDLLASGHHDTQNRANSHNKSYKATENEQLLISPKMAPSWFEQYGTYKKGQILAMDNGLSNSQRTANGSTCFFAEVSESTHNSTVVEERFNVSQVGTLQQNTSSTAIDAIEDSHSHSLPPDAIDSNMIIMPKKRKSTTPDLLPWHKEVMQGSRRKQTISSVELEWAQAANRLIEKVEDEFEIMADGPSITRLQRRLVLTTRLMQLLIPSVPARFLNSDATSSYESLTYFVAKLALGDTCSLISCSGNDSDMLLSDGKMRPEELKTSEKAGDSFFSKFVENFIGKLGKLESNLLRLEKRSSILDLRVECQDLERCSIINRFAQFHGRARTDGVESSLTSENARHRAFHQRNVTAFAMPGYFSEGVPCFSL